MIGKEVLNYRIVSFIGKGGMGSVYLAEHKFISAQKVAIKVINSNMANDYTRSKLKEEAEHLAELKHQNIVTFHDYHIDDQGNIYLIMEYADGKSLDAYIKTETGLIVQERICPLFEPILDAVGYAHKHNILHRDIKPSNVVITTEGIPKILDFGIATLIKQDARENGDNLIVGTPSYMSPEQVRGEKLDERSDIYSLGVMLHQMLTGNPPYDITTLTELQINKKVVEEQLPRLKSYYRYVSDGVQKVVDKATAKNPKDRYQNCAEFKKALHNAIYPPKISTPIVSSLVALAILLIGFGVYIWDYNREKVTFYKDYVEQYGAPVGIGKVSYNTVQHRELTYRFVSSKRKVRRVSLINSRGHLRMQSDMELADHPCDMQFFYSDNGKVDFVKVLDMNGKVLYRKDYNENLTQVTFLYDDQYNTEFTLGNMDPTNPSLMMSSDEKSKISRHLLTYDDKGYVIKLEYAGLYNRKVGDKNGIFANQYTLDDKGRVIEVQYLGSTDEPIGISNAQNLNKRVFKYDENDDWIQIMYLTKDNLPASNGQDVVVQNNSFDQYGNKIAEYYSDFNGKLVYRNDIYVAGIVYCIENGLVMSYSYVDIDKQPCLQKDGYASVSFEYDDNGYITSYTLRSMDGQPYEGTEGVASIRCVNTTTGLPLERWNYDANNELMPDKDGIAGIKFEYDSLGNNLLEMCYDRNQKPFINSDGIAGYRFEYDDKNLLVRQICLDENLTPTTDESGVGVYQLKRDLNGNITQIGYYDPSNQHRVENEYGIAGFNDTYDEYGNHILRSYFDKDLKPTLFLNYVSSYEYKYNDRNQLVAEYYRGLKNELVYDKDKIAGYEWVKDERGNILQEKAIGLKGQLAPGRLWIKFKYDEFNNEIEFRCYDANMEPVLNSQDYHKRTRVYDKKGQVLQESYFDTKEKPTISNKKCASVKYEYNERGLITQTAFFGKDGKPCLNDENYSVHRDEYDKFGRIIKQMYFDTDGKPTDPSKMVPVGVVGYDKYGNMNYIAAQDQNGKFIITPTLGFAIRRNVYDKSGNLLEATYYDTEDKPMNMKNGYHKVEMQYNKSGRKTQEAYFDKNLKPIIVNGAHIMKYSYDERGNLLTQSWYGKTGKPINNQYGYYKEVYTYDSNGTPKYCKMYSSSGGLFCTLKYHSQRGWQLVEEESNPLETIKEMSWKETINALSTELPYDFGEEMGHITLTVCKILGEKECQLKFNVPKENRDISDDELAVLKEFINQMTRSMCQDVLKEKELRVNADLYSADGIIIYCVAYVNN